MKYAVLGPGGVGGLVGGLLARAGHDVIFVVRRDAVETYPHGVHVDSSVYGEFDAPVRVTGQLVEPVDVLWVACKATSLATAILSATPGQIGDPLVVPLLNGLDHIEVLRRRYGASAVVPAAIRTESVRVAPAHIVHRGWHIVASGSNGDDLNHELVPSEPLQIAAGGARDSEVRRLGNELRSAGIGCQLWPEGQVVWQKLAILAPYALATTAVAGPIGLVRSDPDLLRELRQATDEVIRVAAALGVKLDRDVILQTLEGYPDAMRVSMERDLSAGADLEIANIADPIVREGRARSISVQSMERLRQLALLRLAARSL